MGHIDRTQGMMVVGAITPLGMQTLTCTGLVERWSSTYRLVKYQSFGVPNPDPSHETESVSEFDSKAEPERGSRVSRPLKERFEEFRSMVYEKLQVPERGHRDMVASLNRIESSTAEILSFLRNSSSSVGTTSTTTTCATPSLPSAL